MKKQFNRQHGSLYDRGRADSYYGRLRFPHWKDGHETILAETLEEKGEYNAGYDDNEADDFKKEW